MVRGACRRGEFKEGVKGRERAAFVDSERGGGLVVVKEAILYF